MLEFARWKYIVIALVLAFTALYSLPNLYPQDPAVQITAGRGGSLDAPLIARIETLLRSNKLDYKSVAIEKSNLMIRLRDSDTQIKASDLIRPALGNSYTVALNLGSTVPHWLQAIGAKPMSLGLDLQGGVHFLMEVDEQAAIEKRSNAFLDEVRVVLREKKISYSSVVRTPDGIQIVLKRAEDMNRARQLIGANAPELQLSTDSSQAAGLLAVIPDSQIKLITDEAVEQNMGTLRNRINALGVAEPVIQRQGSGRIVVQMPGLQDTAEAKKLIGATATLEYRAVIEGNAHEAMVTGHIPPEARLFFERRLGPDGKPAPIMLSKRTIVTGDQLVNAVSQMDTQSGSPSVSIELNKIGGDRMFKFTQDNVGKRMAAVYIETIPTVKMVDGKEVRTSRQTEEVINAATIQGVFGRQFQTTGLENMQEAQQLALLLRAGSLAAPMVIVEERIVGPSLGAENIARGTQAVTYSFLFVLVFFLVYYKTFGIVTNLALLLNLVIVVAIMSALGATMSLPGLAGIALTVGMSVDANVLINERIREELRIGNTPLASIAAGYDKAAGTIADANVTALLGGIAMAAFGTGPVRGFGITLIIGILASMYTAVSVSRGIATLIYGRRRKLAKVSI